MKCFGLVAFSLVCLYAVLSKRTAKIKRAYADIISGLPDDILVLIISRLPVKDAVRTSVLSRRWRDCQGVLPIDIGSEYISKRFRNPPFVVELFRCLLYRFIDHPGPLFSKATIALLRRCLSSRSRLYSICLEICLSNSVNGEFELCINHLGRLGVEELYLSCYCRADYINVCVPLQLISQIHSLRYLHLARCYLKPNLTGQLMSLETLDINNVKFLPGAMDCILSNCLMLRKLILKCCQYPSKLCFCGPNLQLEYLQIRYGQGVEEIDFYATNLVLFEFMHLREVNFIFDYVPRMENIYISSGPKNIMPLVVGKHKRKMPQVKSLNLTTGGDMFQNPEKTLGGVTMFGNLKRLDITISPTKNINLLLLIPFLHSFHRLEEFHVYAQNLKYDDAQREDERVVFHSMLKKMEIGGFGGTENEITFALHILKGAINLEKMVISRCSKEYPQFERPYRHYVRPWSESTRTNIQQRLQGQAVSSTAQLIIQHEIDF